MSSFKDGSSFSDINKLSKETGGKAVSINSSDSDYIDNIMYELTGGSEGSLGYGTAEFLYDMGHLVAINDITVLFDLPANTSGQWSVSLSEDNFEFNQVSGQFEPSAQIDFSGLHARYMKFKFELFSGLSLTNNSGYETVPTTGVPKVENISINFTKVRDDYIYINPQAVTGDIHQVIVAIDSNKDIAESDKIKIGAAKKGSHNWNDYDTPSKPERNDNEKIVFLDRENTESNDDDNTFVDQLQSVDGFLYKSTYGPWNPEENISIYQKTTTSNGTVFYNTLVNSSNYLLVPRKGYVIFSTRQTDDFCLVFQSADEFSVGVKIENDGSETIELTGLGYMYSERTHE